MGLREKDTGLGVPDLEVRTVGRVLGDNYDITMVGHF
jgi:hypothetical protein